MSEYDSGRYQPSFDEFSILSRRVGIIPVVQRIPADLLTPISVFRIFGRDTKSFLLESVVNGERWARYSIMGRKPFLEYSAGRGETRCFLNGKSFPVDVLGDTPVEQIRELTARYHSGHFSYIDHFYCGLLGYWSYDFVRFTEKFPDDNPDPLGMPDCSLMAPSEVIVFDHLKNEAAVIVNVLTGGGADGYTEAVHRIGKIISEIEHPEPIPPAVVHPDDLDFISHTKKTDYCSAVTKAREYIRNGDVFQVVLSQRFSADYFGDPLPVYRALRTVNPSPYMFCIRLEDAAVIGSSPEMLVRVTNRRIETCPIAGTRPRGKTAEEDERLARELLLDEKETSEHNMLVDLARNDIGRVSQIGTVKATDICHVEKYSHVMHIVTNVEGRLRDGFSGIDVLASILPAGTLSGAPKIRAMEIIDELEPLRRGLYGGAIGYLGFDGNLDTCITIRTAVLKDKKIHVQAGAGIVADSDPETEYRESLNKAGALFSAIEKSGGLR